jgi:hypothetical protein
MRKITVVLIAISMMLVTTTALASKPTQHIYMTMKTPVPTGPYPWVDDGAWGIVNVNDNNGHFVFNGHELCYGDGYTLVYYYEVWPEGIYLGEGIVNCEGNIHIDGYLPDCLPVYDYGTPTSGEYDGLGGKIWLIPTGYITGNIDGVVSFSWHPLEFLFETSLLR